ncbi:hypothetical protein ACHAXR_011628 [Thalassiosira sp. AJA248-18]
MSYEHWSIIAVLAATYCYVWFTSIPLNGNQPISFSPQKGQWSSPPTRLPASVKVAQLTDPDAPTEEVVGTGEQQQSAFLGEKSRQRCQIVYVLGVEGSTHHGFIPIIESLARNQQDPDSGLQYNVDIDPKYLKAGLFGWYKGRTRKWGVRDDAQMNDPDFVKRVVQESCPDNGKKHVMIEWTSFPSGQENDPRSYRVHRQHEWLSMTPEEIANSNKAVQHPTNMTDFIHAYSSFVDIRIIVLHRPFLETIASHDSWDGGATIHSNVIRGFMLMLRRFLDANKFDLVDGTRRLWSLLCVEQIMAKNYEKEEDVTTARNNILNNLATFLGWPNGDCPRCFDDWYESTKDPLKVLGPTYVEILTEHMKLLDGVWPPEGEESVAEQQCGI